MPTLLGVAVATALCLLVVKRSVQLIGAANPHDHAPEVTWVLAGFSLVFAAVTTAGRSCLGAHSAMESRYVPYLAPGMLALYLSYVGTLGGGARSPNRTLAYAFVIAYVGLDLWPRSMDYRQMRYFQTSKKRWVQCFETERDVRACTQEAGGFSIYASGSPVLAEKLAIMEQRGLGFFAPR